MDADDGETKQMERARIEGGREDGARPADRWRYWRQKSRRRRGKGGRLFVIR